MAEKGGGVSMTFDGTKLMINDLIIGDYRKCIEQVDPD